jgi:ubiquinone/menaquinone biosynthesis C-methylase UbiE
MKDRFNQELYKGTYKYYIRYRPPIPREVISIIVKYFDIKSTDRILDIGCGTGQVALAMDGKCKEIVCLDSDPEMIKWAKRVTKGCKTKLTWINCQAEDLGKLRKELGSFKVAISSRAFHRMNQKKVLKALDGLIEEDGGVALFSDRVLWGGNEEWQQTIKQIIQKYLGEKKCAGRKLNEPWENVLARSVFRFIKTHDVPIVRSWDVESIIGYVLSTAFAAPYLFGNQLDKFKEELKNALLSINQKGIFEENAVWSIVLGSRKPHD